ncbi:Hypothetical protein NTJ_12128 [Nesidiocoris tenuis]|uniref:Uncharacterized protein n=1 Tax=Nesidiocoris tenuis TaxID=355587 RepID=A0ABN7B4H1_9HEMI|nr:Hypothetical protein NTJ_12128 [Nesidiocoris tenuis]
MTRDIQSFKERRGSSSRRGSRSQLRRTNTNKDDLKADSNLENGTEEVLGEISEKVDRRWSVHPEDFGASGTSQANSTDNGTDTEDELYFRRVQQRKEETEFQKRLPNRYKFRKRSSFCAPPWVMKAMAYLHWLQPYEDFALQARYALAGVFVLTAIAIVVSNFFIVQES